MSSIYEELLGINKKKPNPHPPQNTFIYAEVQIVHIKHDMFDITSSQGSKDFKNML